jgi:glycosyltransferase involved in cell wall biosynthesis
MRVLMLTSVWPTPDHPEHAPFVVRQAEFLRKQGVTVDVFHVDGRKNPAAYFRAWLKVQRSVASGSYNLVHAQWAQAALPALPVHLPLVVTFRGSDVEGIVRSDHRYAASGWVLRNVARGVARLATEAILVASRLARLLPSRDYHVIPSGLDLDLFSPRPQLEARALLSLLPGRRYVLFAGAPNNPVKRFSLARSVVESLHPRFRAELLVAETVEPSRMPLLMNACDALLLTSVHEGSPNVVKEALACNLPVVSTDVGDVRERISHVEGCAFCESDDAHALAAALAAVLDRGKRVEGRTAVRDLDESLLTRKVIAVYERALTRKACRILQTT